MERCTLCGGKLVNGRCTECGLDNTKNDKKYHLNMHNEKGALLHHGDCEDHLNRDSDWRERLRERQERLSGADAGKPRTGAGDHQGKAGNQGSAGSSAGASGAKAARQSRQERMKELRKRRQTGTVRGKRSPAVILIWIIVLFFAVSVIIGIVNFLDDSGGSSSGSGFGLIRTEMSGAEPEVPAAPAPAGWDTDSENYFELELEPGFYTVGYEIPAGNYQFVCREDTADVYWNTPDADYRDYAFLYSEERRENYEKLFDEECPYFPCSEVIEMAEGTVIQMDDGASKAVLTGMADDDGTPRAHEPQTGLDEVLLEDGMIAGEDFAEGVYDLVPETPEGEDYYPGMYVQVDAEDGENSVFANVNALCARYLRVPFPKGSTVHVEQYIETEENCIIRLVPSY